MRSLGGLTFPCPWQVEHLKEQLEAFGFRKPSGRKEELAQKLVLLLVWLPSLCCPRVARYNDASLPRCLGRGAPLTTWAAAAAAAAADLSACSRLRWQCETRAAWHRMSRFCSRRRRRLPPPRGRPLLLLPAGRTQPAREQPLAGELVCMG